MEQISETYHYGLCVEADRVGIRREERAKAVDASDPVSITVR
jgi:hypothetical protein